MRQGLSHAEVARQLACSSAAVGVWVRRWREAGGDLAALETRAEKPRGPTPKLTAKDAAAIVRAANAAGDVRSWAQLGELAQGRDVKANASTIRRRLQALGYAPRLTATGRTRWGKGAPAPR